MADPHRGGHSASTSAPSAPRRILVADDNEDSATTLAALLRMSGHEVVVALDGREAVDKAAAFRPDVVVLDIGMPKINGYEAAARIRERAGGGCPLLIAMTGYGQDSDRRRTKEAGFDFHLVKPIDFRALQQLLARQVTG